MLSQNPIWISLAPVGSSYILERLRPNRSHVAERMIDGLFDMEGKSRFDRINDGERYLTWVVEVAEAESKSTVEEVEIRHDS